MASFAVLFKENMLHEGGFASRSNDPGGYTYMGLSRQNHPKFPGWPLVAQWVARSGGTAGAYRKIFPDPKLTQMVQDYYIATYWRPLMLDSVQDQFVANHIYDFAMNSGGGQAIINKALGVPGAKINAQTIAVVNANPAAANQKIYAARKAYVMSLPARTNTGKLIPGKKLVDTNPGLITRIAKYAVHPGGYAAPAAAPAYTGPHMINDWMLKFYKV